jgi:hypothetical protein
MLFLVRHLKSHMMTPYWVIDYMNLRGLSAEALKSFISNIFSVFKLSHAFHVGGEISVVGAASMILFSLGLIEVLKRKTETSVGELVTYRILAVFLGLWLIAYWQGKTPISPTRHCLIYLVPILLIQFKGLMVIETSFPKRIPVYFFSLLSVAILVDALSGFRQYLISSKQLANRSKIEGLAINHKVQSIATWAYDFSTLSLLMGEAQPRLKQNIVWDGHVDSLPNERSILVELNSSGEIISEPTEKFSKKFKFSPLYFETTDYDFEPSTSISYGRNLLKIWLLEPKT